MSESVPVTARARARAEITREIKAAGRRHLAEHGASALSLRAVSRELGMASSALYRYFPSRDALLTSLIVDAFDSVGEVAESADESVFESGPGERWKVVGRAVRKWALDNPHEYALVYGSPVPGYVAPTDTVEPATRITSVLTRILEAAGDERSETAAILEPPSLVAAELALVAPEVEPAMMAVGMGVWAQLFGLISLELFGHLDNVVVDRDLFFDHQLNIALGQLGLTA